MLLPMNLKYAAAAVLTVGGIGAGAYMMYEPPPPRPTDVAGEQEEHPRGETDSGDEVFDFDSVIGEPVEDSSVIPDWDVAPHAPAAAAQPQAPAVAPPPPAPAPQAQPQVPAVAPPPPVMHAPAPLELPPPPPPPVTVIPAAPPSTMPSLTPRTAPPPPAPVDSVQENQ